jgi:hypothetical protein
MVKQKSPGEDNAFKAGEAYSRAQSEASKEIARLIRGMLAANAALGKKPPQNRLFCNEATLRSALAEPQHTFANRYFSDLDQRISDKKLTCQTEFVDDLLQYVIRNYPCLEAPQGDAH